HFAQTVATCGSAAETWRRTDASRDAEDIRNACQFLAWKDILVPKTLAEDAFRADRFSPLFETVTDRSSTAPVTIPFSTPYVLSYHQEVAPYSLADACRTTTCIRPIMLIGHCQAQFLGGPLQYLAQQQGLFF